MKYSIQKHINPQDLESPAKYHPAPVYIDTMNLSSLSKKIAHSTSMTVADVKCVIEELVLVIQDELIRGVKIKIDGLGMFKVSFGGTGHENAEDVSALDISNVKITFIADSQVKSFIKGSMKFEKESAKKTGGAVETND